MQRGATAYVEETVIPLIAANDPEVAAEMSVVIEGSHAMGLADELSDLEVMIYLDDDLWRRRGGQAQLLVMHTPEPFSTRTPTYSEFPGQPDCWVIWGHPEVNVHPTSWLLDHQAREVLDGEADVPWEKISLETLHKLHRETLVLRDPRRIIPRLLEATAADRFPEWLWRKLLLLKLVDLKGGPGGFELAVARGKTVETAILFDLYLADLLRLGFLISKQYYSYPKHLRWGFAQLPLAREALPLVDCITASPDWNEKAAAARNLIALYTRLLLDSGLISSQELEYLFPARSGEAWDNPHWFDRVRSRQQKAQQAGCDPRDGWVWDLWDWQ